MFIEWWNERRKRSLRIIMATENHIIHHSLDDLEWRLEPSIGDAIAGDAGISSGLTLHIPSLLLGASASYLFERVDSVIEESVKSHSSISGYGRADVERVITIGSDYLITTMTERYSIPDGRVECESEFSNMEWS